MIAFASFCAVRTFLCGIAVCLPTLPMALMVVLMVLFGLPCLAAPQWY